MVQNCCIRQCPTRSRNFRRAGKRISLHSFPRPDRSPVRYRQWLRRINHKDLVPTATTVVCSEHFTDEDFTVSSRLQAQLMPGADRIKKVLQRSAVPSLKLGPQAEPATRRKCKYVADRERLALLEEIPFDRLRVGCTPTIQLPAAVEPPRPPSPATVMPPRLPTPAIVEPPRPPSPATVEPPRPPTRERNVQCEVGTETLANARRTKHSPPPETIAGGIDTLKRLFPARRCYIARLELT